MGRRGGALDALVHRAHMYSISLGSSNYSSLYASARAFRYSAGSRAMPVHGGRAYVLDSYIQTHESNTKNSEELRVIRRCAASAIG
jgi:hypothetical protein